jgi:hypothetical protein
VNDTTRRHPRTLHEAFPQDHSDWISHHKRPIGERITDWILAVMLVATIAFVCVTWGI